MCPNNNELDKIYKEYENYHNHFYENFGGVPLSFEEYLQMRILVASAASESKLARIYSYLELIESYTARTTDNISSLESAWGSTAR